jgi:hypothetical protein
MTSFRLDDRQLITETISIWNMRYRGKGEAPFIADGWLRAEELQVEYHLDCLLTTSSSRPLGPCMHTYFAALHPGYSKRSSPLGNLDQSSTAVESFHYPRSPPFPARPARHSYYKQHYLRNGSARCSYVEPLAASKIVSSQVLLRS